MYLILGELVPALADPLVALLEERGEEVLQIRSFNSDIGLNWMFGTGHSSSELWLADGRPLPEARISAAIVQKFVPPEANIADVGKGYDVRSEQEASWFGWFWSLKCPVINRYPPIFWFSNWVPVSLWRPWLKRCGLRAMDAVLSNDPEELKAFAWRSNGEVTYTPFSSDKVYRVTTEEDWGGLGRLAELTPVHLTNFKSPLYFASVVGSNVFWNKAAPLALTAIQPALTKLAALANLSFIEIGLLIVDGQPNVHSVNPFPKLTEFKSERCLDIANALVNELGRDMVGVDSENADRL